MKIADIAGSEGVLLVGEVCGGCFKLDSPPSFRVWFRKDLDKNLCERCYVKLNPDNDETFTVTHKLTRKQYLKYFFSNPCWAWFKGIFFPGKLECEVEGNRKILPNEK